MDIASIVGLIAGAGFILMGILLGSGIGLFVNAPSMAIVIGGTIGATLVAFPLKDFSKVGKALKRIFMFKLEKPEDLVARLVEISNKARKGGLLSIEGDIKTIEDPYFASAIQMTVDGVKTADIAAIMQKKMGVVLRENKSGITLFTVMGAYAPAFGMIGTLIGLVQMLATLDDPSTIGPKMAVAMITTFYGAVMSNLVFLPMADKLKVRSAEEIKNMTLLYEGVISIREGEHPRLMEDKLNIYLMDAKQSKEDKKK
ncbi:MotA/TolQ/ExbB proton channel family protein [Desulfobotulus sp. H1]|uniref:MotA/TolQ/ExbB proton channel family protein n=1 Tax=Desulfobotulus pelophilus TaxID=2823377 RepID=A0ABT3N5J2_9BACT|nr:MotA/TolQ/ExbB proton channel family protein [Desulfobotulus pelophilus]MCW7752714.1 MotA/TolQ/ExbB proton channel family protein [Desulfobotulus pelophilus]